MLRPTAQQLLHLQVKKARASWADMRTSVPLVPDSDKFPEKPFIPDPKKVFSQARQQQTEASRTVQALHLKPLKRDAVFGVPSCDLQMRSFSLQPLEFYCGFALRAAYYLGLSASGPIPLPRLTERWTVPKSHFIFKKSQENFERVTLRRVIQIKDGHPETVHLWLAYLRKNQYYGVGMKANVWEFGMMGQDRSMNQAKMELCELKSTWSQVGQTKPIIAINNVADMLSSRLFKEAAGLRQPSAANDIGQ